MYLYIKDILFLIVELPYWAIAFDSIDYAICQTYLYKSFTKARSINFNIYAKYYLHIKVSCVMKRDHDLPFTATA